MSDWNTKVIVELRDNQGRVCGPFQGAPIVLLHHRGRKTGDEHVSPTMYMASDEDNHVIYVFATKSGAPTNPQWYYNLLDAGEARVEVGTEEYAVTVIDVTGEDRDRIYAE